MDKGLRIIIAGGRDFNDYELLRKECLRIISDKVQRMGYKTIPREKVTIISGTAKGADTLGEKFSAEFNLGLEKFPADWTNDGKAAGPIRNKKMLDYALADPEDYEGMLIAFWDGKSSGTANMIKISKPWIETDVVGY